MLIQMSKQNKTKAGSYIELPNILASKKAIINVKNLDNKCVVWSLLSYLHNDKIDNHPERITKYTQYLDSVIKPKDIVYPINIQSDVKKFEKLNDIKINVFYYEETDKNFNNLLTLYNTNIKKEKVCNLLLLTGSKICQN